MPHVAIFFDSIQQREIDAIQVKNFVQCFSTAVSNVRKIYEDNTLDSEPSSKRRCVEHAQHGNKKNNRLAALEICDILKNTIEDRFIFSSHLSA